MGLLEDLLDDIKEDSDDNKKRIGDEEGPLDPPDDAAVAANLDAIESRIDQILNPQAIPNLNPSDAGTSAGDAPMGWDASDFAGYFYDASCAAHDAHDNRDDETCGDNLRTMKDRIDAFRDVCGV